MINNETIKKLQFDQILNEVQRRAIGDYSKQQIATLPIQTNLSAVESRQQETFEARLIIDSGQHVPFMGLVQINRLMDAIDKGLLLAPNELIEVADFLRSNRRIQKFFEKNQFQTPLLYKYSKNLSNFLAIEETIYQKIQGQRILDDASKGLKKVRKQLKETEKEIEEKLIKFLKHPKNKAYIQESLIVKKGDHFTIPIKAAYKNKIPGSVIEQSSKGQTVFVELVAIAKLNERMALLQAEESAEEYQLLAELTGFISEQAAAIGRSIETMTTLDIIFARGKYSREINGITPKVNKEEKIHLIAGRHPLLSEEAVPLNFTLGHTYRGMVITGANAGGKTLVLKTVGLLTLMTMFGLQIPAQIGSEMAVFDQLFVDIGDQQNIENALSTFSGHMKNVAEIMQQSKRNNLVLLDEIGSGTEPNEGAGLAIAILESLYQKGALIIATTHYGEIKRFAQAHQDFIPAAMAFDQKTLTPKYQLLVGQVGDSQALWIAKKMNMSETLLQKAADYIQAKEYPTDKKGFSTLEQKKTQTTQILDVSKRYNKGDRVFLTESKEIGLVFEDEGAATVQVFVHKHLKEVLRKRIKIQASAQELYPADYDLDSLFSDFQTRKRKKDLERGSKKAYKRLIKEAKLRREETAQDRK